MKKRMQVRGQAYANFLSKPTATYLLILGCTGALTGLGLVMVLSASSVTSLSESGNTFAIFLKQLLFLAVGICLSFIAMRMKLSHWESLARLALPIGAVALVLPIIFGETINGNRNWIPLGPFTLQPSEFAKLALILYCALQLRKHLERKARGLQSNAIGLVSIGTLGFLFLILLGRDLGTAIIVAGIVFGMLFISGVDLKVLFSISGIFALVGLALAVTNPARLRRLSAVLDPFAPEVYKMAGWQPAHSLMSLASGGLFGVGIGASKQKWANLAEAHTDFIFSVIGEELGLLGTLTVVFLFVTLIYAIFRVAITTKDLFQKYVVTGIGCWIILQVLVNLMTVVGIIPVIGVTLPFISYGGSSLVANCLAIAFVLNVARRESDFKAARLARRTVK
ncbi:MAG: putative lipid II flippase FtsW [Actinobacteria bacterium]|nr:putative lipid II flippase FtsW [Actinomycetota bacterium]MDA2981213.1 putative lipid II flippase FtsW [Actinomycetota bacterium]MDA2996135.1 putative lipid II flippase FtsW [Actinomycetota bacterium]